MRIPIIFAFVAGLAAQPLGAQTAAAPPGPTSASLVGPRNAAILEATRAAVRGSTIGDLAVRDGAAGDLELRYWAHDVNGIEGVVIRREGGSWKGWSARIVTRGSGEPVLELAPLDADRLDVAWADVIEAGAPVLPAGIPRSWIRGDGYVHAVELRIGKSYRASVVECALPPQNADDYRVQEVAGVLARAFPSVRIGCTR